MRPSKYALIVFPIILTAMATVVYFTLKDETTCDSNILMKDGTTYSATQVIHNNDGMTWIKQCNGMEKSFPTVDIKIVEEINQ